MGSEDETEVHNYYHYTKSNFIAYVGRNMESKYRSLLVKYKALKEKLSNQGSDSQVGRYSV